MEVNFILSVWRLDILDGFLLNLRLIKLLVAHVCLEGLKRRLGI